MSDTLEPRPAHRPRAALPGPGLPRAARPAWVPQDTAPHRDGPIYINGPAGCPEWPGVPGGSPNLSPVHWLPVRVLGAIVFWATVAVFAWVSPVGLLAVLAVGGGVALWRSRSWPAPPSLRPR